MKFSITIWNPKESFISKNTTIFMYKNKVSKIISSNNSFIPFTHKIITSNIRIIIYKILNKF